MTHPYFFSLFRNENKKRVFWFRIKNRKNVRDLKSVKKMFATMTSQLNPSPVHSWDCWYWYPGGDSSTFNINRDMTENAKQTC